MPAGLLLGWGGGGGGISAGTALEPWCKELISKTTCSQVNCGQSEHMYQHWTCVDFSQEIKAEHFYYCIYDQIWRNLLVCLVSEIFQTISDTVACERHI